MTGTRCANACSSAAARSPAVARAPAGADQGDQHLTALDRAAAPSAAQPAGAAAATHRADDPLEHADEAARRPGHPPWRS